ncbi:10658_t:CDS:2 [Funneliformis caledonium]|uniref:10658_t:CDS:1 n=1 Tax=Funneliformis caledonium TaxID=1117310 RepID=A0A9N8V3R3_9GLOM|nr:10658_t:CDS:2 [Funneliformis caledonium]
MLSSVAKGKKFEREICRILRICESYQSGIQTWRTVDGPTVNVLPRFRKATAITLKRSLGDGGVDIIGNLARFPFVVQCNDRRRKLGVEVVRELEGTLSRYHKDTIGIIVIPSDDKFTTQARRAARTSEFNIILTDKEKI